MKYIDLTHTFNASMPVYPGDPLPELKQIASLEKDGYNDFQITSGMHVGTHMDAPLHMIENGKKMPELSLDKFFGKGHLIAAQGQTVIGAQLLNGISAARGDIVFVMTGFSKKFGGKKYFESYPELSQDFAKKIIEMGVSIVGMDTPSPDRSPYKIHKMLLDAGVLIIENLTNLDALTDAKSFFVYALPAKLDTEASFVRVIATVK